MRYKEILDSQFWQEQAHWAADILVDANNLVAEQRVLGKITNLQFLQDQLWGNFPNEDSSDFKPLDRLNLLQAITLYYLRTKKLGAPVQNIYYPIVLENGRHAFYKIEADQNNIFSWALQLNQMNVGMHGQFVTMCLAKILE